MYALTRAHTHTLTRACTHARAYVQMYIHGHTHSHVCTGPRMCAFMGVQCTHSHVCAHICVPTRVHIHGCTHTHSYTHMHAHIHIPHACTSMGVHMHRPPRVHIHGCTVHTHTCAHICVPTHAYTFTGVHTHPHAHIHIPHTCTFVGVHMHTLTDVCTHACPHTCAHSWCTHTCAHIHTCAHVPPHTCTVTGAQSHAHARCLAHSGHSARGRLSEVTTSADRVLWDAGWRRTSQGLSSPRRACALWPGHGFGSYIKHESSRFGWGTDPHTKQDPTAKPAKIISLKKKKNYIQPEGRYQLTLSCYLLGRSR